MGPIGLISVSRSVVCGFLALALLGCDSNAGRQVSARADSTNPSDRTTSPSPAPVPTGVSEDGEWRIPAKDYASARFSGLDEINVGNVAQLQPAEQKGDKKTTRRSREGGEGGTER